MIVMALVLSISPATHIDLPNVTNTLELSYTKKKRKAGSGAARKFRSCKAARAAGYTHMRRGQPGYSKGLDRDGDGVACDKVA
jgi:hypothetical protein